MATLRAAVEEFPGGWTSRFDEMTHTMFSSSRRASPSFAALVCAVLAPFASTAAPAMELGGNAAITSDYVWRGTTQTQGDPAAQAGARVSGEAGWYGAIWASGVEFAPETHASSELDLVAGWTGPLSADWGLDVNLTHYRYPSTSVDLDWTELAATATWRGNYWLQVAYSDEALASDGSGTYAQLGARLPLADSFRLEAAAGYYWLDDVYDDSYAHLQLGGVWAFKAPFELRLTAHDTDSAARRLFPGLAGSRVEAALQASF